MRRGASTNGGRITAADQTSEITGQEQFDMGVKTCIQSIRIGYHVKPCLIVNQYFPSFRQGSLTRIVLLMKRYQGIQQATGENDQTQWSSFLRYNQSGRLFCLRRYMALI